MIFELTRDYSIIVPLMLSNLIAFFISHRLQPQQIYEALLRLDGIHLPTREDHPEAGRLQVVAAMRPIPGTLSPRTDVADALARMKESPLQAWPVSDDSGLAGMVSRSELEQAVAQGRTAQPMAVLLKERDSEDRHTGALPHVHPDHNLTLALERLGILKLDVLPVVSRDNARELLGVLTLSDILKSYGVAGTPDEWRPSGRS
jgi:CIC family chloride channel protein